MEQARQTTDRSWHLLSAIVLMALFLQCISPLLPMVSMDGAHAAARPGMAHENSGCADALDCADSAAADDCAAHCLAHAAATPTTPLVLLTIAVAALVAALAYAPTGWRLARQVIPLFHYPPRYAFLTVRLVE